MNIQKYFEIKKKSYDKEVKTVDAADVAVKHAENIQARELAKHLQTNKIEINRKVYWFEKYSWFISSENYLILAGQNA